MNIQEFLKRVDEGDAAHAAGAKVSTVRKWRQGARVPSRAKAARLIEWSHGLLSFDDIYAPQKKAA